MSSVPSSDPTTVNGSRMVFVGGLHRSGTTPLSRVLAAHPSVSGLHDTGVTEDEGQHLQSVYPAAVTHGGPGRFAFSSDAHLTEQSALATPQSAERLWADWMPYWDPSRPLLLEKSPPNLVMGRFLQTVFPGSSLIVVLRHPVVVSLSTVKWRRLASRHWWRHASVHTMVRHWFAAHELLREDAPRLARLHVVKYEELLEDPRGQLAGIQRFLGLEEPFQSDLLRSGHSSQYEARWAAMATGVVASSTRRRIERDFADQAAGFGYDISDLRAHRPWSLTG
jgi:Sulfotransferase family